MAEKKKHKTSLLIDQKLWDSFVKTVIKFEGKTSGGALTRSLSEAMEDWIRKKKGSFIPMKEGIRIFGERK